jgi:hypothetical protein
MDGGLTFLWSCPKERVFVLTEQEEDKPMSVQFADLMPTHSAFRCAGFKTVDAFRMYLHRNPNALKPEKIGSANFYKRDALEALKLKRERADAPR